MLGQDFYLNLDQECMIMKLGSHRGREVKSQCMLCDKYVNAVHVVQHIIIIIIHSFMEELSHLL